MSIPIAYRPFQGSPEPIDRISPKLRHPIFAWLGVRPLASEHTKAEDVLLRKYSRLAAKILVEIGVAEGGSAVSMRESMPANASLYIIDPYLPGRIPFLNASYLAASKSVEAINNGSIVWIKDFSFDAIKNWEIDKSIDLLFIDGDHSEAGCRKDWEDWSSYVGTNGFVIFHDARVFPKGWTSNDWGSVKVVNFLFKSDNSLANWRIVEEVDSMVVVQKLA